MGPRSSRAAALALGLLTAWAARAAADPALGKRVFVERCSACHGETGSGDGPAAAALTPRPRNFHDPVFWKDRTGAQIRKVVKDGLGPASMMPSFGEVLSDAEIDAVAAYVETFRPSPGAAAGDGKVSAAGGGEDPTRGPDRSGGGR